MLRLLTDKIRPFASNFSELERASLHTLCARLYEAYYRLEADEDLGEYYIGLDSQEVLIIYAHVCEEDSDVAAELLHQVRQVMYELRSGRPAVKLASRKEVERMFAADVLPEDDKAYGDS